MNGPARTRPTIAQPRENCYLPGMERLFGDPSYTNFVLQDRKRLPARFFAQLSGAQTCLLG